MTGATRKKPEMRKVKRNRLSVTTKPNVIKPLISTITAAYLRLYHPASCMSFKAFESHTKGSLRLILFTTRSGHRVLPVYAVFSIINPPYCSEF
jgi:hypothetical protein